MKAKCMQESIQTQNAPAAVGPYSQAVKADGRVFTAGQLPLHPESGELVSTGIEQATERAIENLKAVLDAAGSSLDNVLKTTVYIADMNDFAAMNEVYARYFGDSKPARSTVQAVLPKGALVEIDAVALCD